MLLVGLIGLKALLDLLTTKGNCESSSERGHLTVFTVYDRFLKQFKIKPLHNENHAKSSGMKLPNTFNLLSTSATKVLAILTKSKDLTISAWI